MDRGSTEIQARLELAIIKDEGHREELSRTVGKVQRLGATKPRASEEANKFIAAKLKIIAEIQKNRLTIGKENSESMTKESKSEELDRIHSNLLSKLDSDLDNDIKLHKIFTIIRELFEQSLLELAKSTKSKKEVNKKEPSNSNSNDVSISKQSAVAKPIDGQSLERIKNLYKELFDDKSLNELWINITEFLTNLNELFANNWALLNPFNHNLQLIVESFFIIYKILNDDESYELLKKSKSAKNKEIGKKSILRGISTLIEKEQSNENSLLERSFSSIRETNLDANEMFLLMCEKNKNLLNMMIKQNLKLLSGSLSLIVKKMPKILDFEIKRLFFKAELKKLKQGHHPQIRIRVNRSNLFMDSYTQIQGRKAIELKGKFNIEFVDEEGYDAGGVTREWFLALSREMLNPNYALFKPSANSATFQPDPRSRVNPEHLKFFKFVGRIIGKALHDGLLLDCYFTRSFYKHILGMFNYKLWSLII